MGKSIKEALMDVGCETDKEIEEALSLVEECIEPLNKVISQRNVLKFFNISTEKPNKVTANDITIESEDLYRTDEKKAMVTQVYAM